MLSLLGRCNTISIGVLIFTAWYANRISTSQANKFIYGVDSTTNEHEGSGPFFDRIANTYDLLNQLISLGHHTQWRRTAISKIIPSQHILDVATGTGDVALAISAELPNARVVGLDPSKEMLRNAQRKIDFASTRVGDVKLVQGTVEALPFENMSFDAAVVSFGVRNFKDRAKGLHEIARVLNDDSRLVVLEVSTPRIRARPVYWAFRFTVKSVVFLAGLFSGEASAYRYLLQSMDEFPHKDEFIFMLEAAGFNLVEYQRLPPLGCGPELYVAVKSPK